MIRTLPSRFRRAGSGNTGGGTAPTGTSRCSRTPGRDGPLPRPPNRATRARPPAPPTPPRPRPAPPPARRGPMRPDRWPPRPPPQTTEPRYECEISRAAQLRAIRAGLRTWLPDVLADQDDDGAVLDTLLLAVDELASNGLRHGSGPVRVRAAPTGQGLLLDVSDDDPHHGPEPAVGRDPALGGMGLHMVAPLTGERGWSVGRARAQR